MNTFCIQTRTCMHFTLHFPFILSYYVYLSSINAFEKPLLPFVKLTLSSKDMQNFTRQSVTGAMLNSLAWKKRMFFCFFFNVTVFVLIVHKALKVCVWTVRSLSDRPRVRTPHSWQRRDSLLPSGLHSPCGQRPTPPSACSTQSQAERDDVIKHINPEKITCVSMFK